MTPTSDHHDHDHSDADVLRPSPSLWERLAVRIASEKGEEPLLSSPPQGWAEPEWTEAAPGISVKLLATDTHENRVSMLVRLAPGASTQVTAVPKELVFYAHQDLEADLASRSYRLALKVRGVANSVRKIAKRLRVP